MKMQNITAIGVLAGFLAAGASGATTITGMSLFSTDTAGNACTPFNSCSQSRGLIWTTVRLPNLWVIRGEMGGDFLNGPTSKDSAINVPLSSGTYTYTIYGEPQAVGAAYYGLNLFFNFDNVHPKISVFAPVNTSSTGFFPAISANSGQTFDVVQTLTPGSGKLIFQDGQMKVKLTSFQWSIPAVYQKDRVSAANTTPNTNNDYIGQFTLEVSAPPVIASGGVTNAASFAPHIAPGSLISIFGTDLASAIASATSTPLPVNLAGTSVTIGGKAAPLVYVSPTQINAQIPYEVLPAVAVPVVVTAQGIASPPMNADVVISGPGIFQYGQKHAVVQNQDYSTNAVDNPARAGSYVVAYLTGSGRLDNAVPTGSPAGSEPLSHPMYPVTATIGGRSADILFAGLTPGFVGLMQVNLHVPILAPDDYPLVVTIDGIQSNAAIVSVR